MPDLHLIAVFVAAWVAVSVGVGGLLAASLHPRRPSGAAGCPGTHTYRGE